LILEALASGGKQFEWGNPTTESVVGGHAVVIVGYDTATQRFIIRNSWGVSWGQSGYFTIPFEYVLNAGLASDFWSIRLVE